MTTATTLRVYPNPFAALDHEGQPVGTYPFDPTHAGGSRRWVGASIDKSPSTDGKPKTRGIAQPWDRGTTLTARGPKGQLITRRAYSAPDVRICWAHDLSPQTLPLLPHYLAGLRHGGALAGLLAADAATASAAGIPFVTPQQALHAAAGAAIARWTAEQGTPPPTATWPPNLRHAAGIDATSSGDVATVLATIHDKVAAASSDSFELASWDPADTAAAALYAAVVAALAAAGLTHVAEQVVTVSGSVKGTALILSVADLRAAATRAAAPSPSTTPAWLLSLVPTPPQAGAAGAGGVS